MLCQTTKHIFIRFVANRSYHAKTVAKSFANSDLFLVYFSWLQERHALHQNLCQSDCVCPHFANAKFLTTLFGHWQYDMTKKKKRKVSYLRLNIVWPDRCDPTCRLRHSMRAQINPSGSKRSAWITKRFDKEQADATRASISSCSGYIWPFFAFVSSVSETSCSPVSAHEFICMLFVYMIDASDWRCFLCADEWILLSISESSVFFLSIISRKFCVCVSFCFFFYCIHNFQNGHQLVYDRKYIFHVPFLLLIPDH